MRESLDVLGHVDNLLEVLVVPVVEDWVVDDDSVNGWVRVGREDCFFNAFSRDGAEGIFEATEETLALSLD